MGLQSILLQAQLNHQHRHLDGAPHHVCPPQGLCHHSPPYHQQHDSTHHPAHPPPPPLHQYAYILNVDFLDVRNPQKIQIFRRKISQNAKTTNSAMC